ncbi:MAG: hypothetical protein HKN26_01105 [Acidimicrobiales bacterium]|nr:hypothetical protein [Acidimicrobiales bacterium]
MRSSALVIGGTGPTGPGIVSGLEQRGYDVTILHTGAHELDEVAHLPHLHGDVRSSEGLTTALAGSRHDSFDVVVATYGRLRAIAEILVDRCGHLLSVGGMPAYQGYFNADDFTPSGLPVPTGEDGPTATEAQDGKSYRIRRTEEIVFEHHASATHFRYPIVYGPRQLIPREWLVVRRIIDRRPFIILPDGGLTLNMMGFTENLAHAVLLAVDRPDAAAGQVFNCGDEEVLTLRQMVELIAAELDHDWEVISMPYELAPCTKPLVAQHRTTHKVLDIGHLRHRLGYADVVPAREAVRQTARWLLEHRPDPGGMEEMVLEDPFDYGAEDALVSGWRSAIAALPAVEWSSPPGYGLGYGGPGATRVRPDTRI